MKFMMNGALTIGTHDGATIEMSEAEGEENFFPFGLTAEQVAQTRPWYDPHWHHDHDPETRRALDAIFSDHFSPSEPGSFEPIRDVLLTRGDRFMHLADLNAYVRTQDRLARVHADPEDWFRKVVLNVGGLGQVLQRPRDPRVRPGDLGRADRSATASPKPVTVGRMPAMPAAADGRRASCQLATGQRFGKLAARPTPEGERKPSWR